MDRLSVVAPAFDEERRLPALLARVGEAWLADTPIVLHELIVVDDGSSDGTGRLLEAAAAREPRLRVLRLRSHRGKGAAVKAGMLAATGDCVLLTDVDMSTPLEEVGRLFAALDAGLDVALGSRAAPGARLYRRQRLDRHLLGAAANTLIRRAARVSFRDTQCGFKLFRAAAARELFSRQTLDGYLFDAELCVNARRLGLRVAEVPVSWGNDRDSRIRTFRSMPEIARELVMLRRLARDGRAPSTSSSGVELSRPRRTRSQVP